MRRLFALAALTAILAQASTALAIDQVGNYKENPGGGAYSYSNATGKLTGTSTGTFSYNTAAIQAGAPALVLEPASLTISTTALGPVTSTPVLGGTQLDQLVDATITIKDTSGGPLNGLILLMATIHNGDLNGLKNGALTTLIANDPSTFGTTISYSTTVPGFNASALVPPSAVTFTLNPIVPALTVGANGNYNSYTGRDTANFSATVVPEPASMAMALMALPILGLAYRLRRKATA